MNAEYASMATVPRWAVMWLLAVAMFAAGKAAMLRGAGLRRWRFAGFAFGWVGMDPGPFLGNVRVDNGVPAGTWRWSLLNTAAGSALLWGAARHFTHPLAAGWTGMVGLILVLHFGIFGLLAHAWRAAGIPVVPIMRCPVAATSLSEFWGRRWNLPFRDLAHQLVFTPTSRCWGHKAALWLSFAASGVAHELVISVPAGAGYGLPTAYFLLQALGITLERRVDRKASCRSKGGPSNTMLRRWLWTHAFTVLPAGLLFHPPFVERVMVPFFHAIGALS
jgi:alginate O-acetyltransferase complex protein AlgI